MRRRVLDVPDMFRLLFSNVELVDNKVKFKNIVDGAYELLIDSFDN